MSEEKEVIHRIWVPGCACCDSCADDDTDKVSLSFEIPGVKKEDIDLRVIAEGLRLVAKRDKTTEYVSEYSFACSADVENVKAEYNDGVLDIVIPLVCKDPYADSKKVELT